MIKPLLSLLFITMSLLSSAKDSYYFRVWFTDKRGSEQLMSQPESFLSTRAIERRAKQNIDITQQDLPLVEEYCQQVNSSGRREICRSKWLNAMVVECSDSLLINGVEALPFVKEVEFIHSSKYDYDIVQDDFYPIASTPKKSHYGAAEESVKMVDAEQLHKRGYWGRGVYVALLDAGFCGVDTLAEYFDIERVIYAQNLVEGNSNVYCNSQHGTAVLSLMLANREGEFVGVSPHCDYALIVSEDIDREAPYEEDLWVRGAEIADSIGADIVVSSLGYGNFSTQVTKNISTLGAESAFARGMVVVTSCGNSGEGGITRPADAPNAIAVGSVNSKGKISHFSSKGVVDKHTVKPNLVALGEEVAVVTGNGTVKLAYGSSFAAPSVAGVVALLWQVNKKMGANEIVKLINELCSLKGRPDSRYGYGVFNLTRRALRYIF